RGSDPWSRGHQKALLPDGWVAVPLEEFLQDLRVDLRGPLLRCGRARVIGGRRLARVGDGRIDAIGLGWSVTRHGETRAGQARIRGLLRDRLWTAAISSARSCGREIRSRPTKHVRQWEFLGI